MCLNAPFASPERLELRRLPFRGDNSKPSPPRLLSLHPTVGRFCFVLSSYVPCNVNVFSYHSTTSAPTFTHNSRQGWGREFVSIFPGSCPSGSLRQPPVHQILTLPPTMQHPKAARIRFSLAGWEGIVRFPVSGDVGITSSPLYRPMFERPTSSTKAWLRFVVFISAPTTKLHFSVLCVCVFLCPFFVSAYDRP